MKQDILRKVQLTQLDIFKQVHEIAKNNNIVVYLAGGTLLGAVRHKGFIPWDDDLDIMVPRRDFERLMECLKAELPEAYWLQNYDTDEQYWLSFAKVRKKGTLYKEKAIKDIDDDKCGIWIDIFALDNSKKNTGLILKLRKTVVQTIGFALKRKELNHSLQCFSRRYIPSLLFWGLFSSRSLKKIQIFFMKKVGTKDPKYYVSLSSPYRIEKEAYPVEWFVGAEMLRFEDSFFEAPAQPDRLLTQLYGDYMTPPPVEKRGGHNMDDQYPIKV